MLILVEHIFLIKYKVSNTLNRQKRSGMRSTLGFYVNTNTNFCSYVYVSDFFAKIWINEVSVGVSPYNTITQC